MEERYMSSNPESSAGDGRIESVNGMPYRTLGRTGERVSLVGLGGWHIGKPTDEREGVEIIRTALDNGINFLDNAWDYHQGVSEIRMGKALKNGYREKAFLMTKIDGRTRKEANRQLEESLRRLQVDTIDLLQIHEVIHPDDPERVFAPGGAMEALLAAREAGKIRYIGFTGHKDPEIHLKMLSAGFAHGFTFDAVQMPLNVMDHHYHSFEKNVLPVLLEHGIGVLGMKAIGFSFFLMSCTVSPVECLRYAMNLPVSVVITGCDSIPILHQALEVARSFQPMSEEEVAAVLKRTEGAGSRGRFELFKTTRLFDDTYYSPELLG